MIIGNPYVFAITVDTVNAWNDDESFNNGLLFVDINGIRFPKNIISATLNTELYELVQKLENVKENKSIYKMKKEEAFIWIYRTTFPENYDIDNNYSYNLTPFVLEDNNCFVFMVGNGKEIRFLASELKYIVEESVHNLEGLEVVETYISVEKLQEMVKELKLYQLEIHKR